MVRAAARRCGLSVSQWLDWVITEAAAEKGARPAGAPSENREEALDDNELTIRAVHKRIDDIASQIERLAQHENCVPQPAQHDGSLLRLEHAINRLSDRLHTCILEMPSDPSYQYQQPSGRVGLFSRLLSARN
jgi:hypothetical protein